MLLSILHYYHCSLLLCWADFRLLWCCVCTHWCNVWTSVRFRYILMLHFLFSHLFTSKTQYLTQSSLHVWHVRELTVWLVSNNFNLKQRTGSPAVRILSNDGPKGEPWKGSVASLRLAQDRRNIDHYGHGLPLLFFLARYRKMCLIMPWPWKCESLRVPVHVNVLRTSKLNEPFRSSMRREHASPNPFSTGRKGWTREMIHEPARRRRARSSASAATATFCMIPRAHPAQER
jgi:hypothetical protein